MYGYLSLSTHWVTINSESAVVSSPTSTESRNSSSTALRGQECLHAMILESSCTSINTRSTRAVTLDKWIHTGKTESGHDCQG